MRPSVGGDGRVARKKPAAAREHRLHALSEGELAIIKRCQDTGNPNYFTDFFFRSDTSGTWWRPDDESQKRMKSYKVLHETWVANRHPDGFTYNNRRYTVVPEDDPRFPSFHDHHGFIFSSWQLRAHQAKQPIIVIVGGYGSGKTISGVASLLYWAATVPGFQAIVLAPTTSQINSIYNDALMLMEGTPYGERFLMNAVQSPMPRLTIGNSLVGSRNQLHFFVVGDPKGTKKILSMNLDAALIDQAEQLVGFDTILRHVGSRMRGMYKGRARMRHIRFVANSEFNDEMWALYDQAETEPDRVLAMSPKTKDNQYITEQQLAEMTKDVGGDEDSVKVHLEGERPIGGGDYFSGVTIKKMIDLSIDLEMTTNLEAGTVGYRIKRKPGVGIVEYVMPPVKDRLYLVTADPGYGNAPARNAPAVGVWDYTEFPAAPLTMRAFWWLDGNNTGDVWASCFVNAVEEYNARQSNAIDNTGWQSMYDRALPALKSINAAGFTLANNKKYGYLNFFRLLGESDLVRIPRISGMLMQMGRYKLPDEGLAQDIVIMMILAAAWVEPLFYIHRMRENQKNEKPVAPVARNHRPIPRGRVNPVARGRRGPR